MSQLAIIKEVVQRAYEKHLPNDDGQVAQYIPELANADPDRFGIAVCTVNNEVVTVGVPGNCRRHGDHLVLCVASHLDEQGAVALAHQTDRVAVVLIPVREHELAGRRPIGQRRVHDDKRARTRSAAGWRVRAGMLIYFASSGPSRREGPPCFTKGFR